MLFCTTIPSSLLFPFSFPIASSYISNAALKSLSFELVYIVMVLYVDFSKWLKLQVFGVHFKYYIHNKRVCAAIYFQIGDGILLGCYTFIRQHIVDQTSIAKNLGQTFPPLPLDIAMGKGSKEEHKARHGNRVCLTKGYVPSFPLLCVPFFTFQS